MKSKDSCLANSIPNLGGINNSSRGNLEAGLFHVLKGVEEKKNIHLDNILLAEDFF